MSCATQPQHRYSRTVWPDLVRQSSFCNVGFRGRGAEVWDQPIRLPRPLPTCVSSREVIELGYGLSLVSRATAVSQGRFPAGYACPLTGGLQNRSSPDTPEIRFYGNPGFMSRVFLRRGLDSGNRAGVVSNYRTQGPPGSEFQGRPGAAAYLPTPPTGHLGKEM